MVINPNQKGPQVVQIPFYTKTDKRPFSRDPFGTGGARIEDVLFDNVIFEAVHNQLTNETNFHAYCRDGFNRVFLSPGDKGRGIYWWRQNSKLYLVYGNKIRNQTDNLDLGVTLAGTTGLCGFAETRPGATTQYLGINDGVALYLIAPDNSVIVENNVVINTSSVANPTTITTATNHGLNTGNKIIIFNHVGSTPNLNGTIYTITKTGATTFTIPVNVTVGGTGGTIGLFPTNNGTLEYMDTYWFTQKTDGSIWNCNSDDPTTWPVDKFIFAQMKPGRGVGLARQNNVLVAFSDEHMQMFYDAANPAGSPLANIEQAMQQIGCANGNTLAHQENMIYWASNTRTGGYTIYQLDGTTNLKDIGTPEISRFLEIGMSANSPTAGFILRMSGHIFYVLCSPTRKTYIYDQTNDIWTTWSVAAIGTPWPFFTGTQGVSAGEQCMFVQAYNDTYIGITGSNVFNASQQDVSLTGIGDPIPITMTMQLNQSNLGTNKRKFYNRLDILGDFDNDNQSTFLVDYSDNDYVSYSTARALSANAFPRYFSTNLGNSRRRGWRFKIQNSLSGSPILRPRFSGIELEIELEG